MNACDDRANPSGEFVDAPRSGVDVVMAAAEKVSAPARAVVEIRELAEYWRDALNREPSSPAHRQAGLSILGILARYGL